MIRYLGLFLLICWSVGGTKGQCNKEWIKFMIVNVCGYNKRSEGGEGPFNAGLLSSREVDKRLYFMDDSAPSPTHTKQQHIGGLLGIKEDWLEEGDLGLSKVNIRRNIKNMVENCCKTLCTIDDFKGVCY